MPFERTMTEVLAAHGDAMKDEFRKCLPATVTAVNVSAQTVDVQAAVRNPTFDEFGSPTFDAARSFRNVPLGVIRGGGFFVWVPVAVGDSVLLVFSDLSADTWRASTPGTGPVTPVWLGKHTEDSPFALPMVAPDAAVLSTADAQKLVIGKDGSAAQMKVSATDVEFGSGSDKVALTAKIDALINILTNLSVAGPSESGYGALVTSMAAYKLANWTASPTVGSTLVKAQ